MDNQTNPLEKLFADDVKSLDLNLLSTFLANYIAIDRNTQEFGFRTPFKGLSNNLEKLEVLFLASKARKILTEKQEEMTTSEIVKLSIMPEGSVKGSVKRLFDDKKILKNDKGYYLPDYRVSEIVKSGGQNDQ